MSHTFYWRNAERYYQGTRVASCHMCVLFSSYTWETLQIPHQHCPILLRSCMVRYWRSSSDTETFRTYWRVSLSFIPVLWRRATRTISLLCLNRANLYKRTRGLPSNWKQRFQHGFVSDLHRSGLPIKQFNGDRNSASSESTVFVQGDGYRCHFCVHVRKVLVTFRATVEVNPKVIVRTHSIIMNIYLFSRFFPCSQNCLELSWSLYVSTIGSLPPV